MMRPVRRTTIAWCCLTLACCGPVACTSPEPRPPQPPTRAAQQRPNVVIFLVDTLRADAVGWGGATRETTPRLGAWAKTGTIFSQATTPAGWTRSAVISLFTGLYPAAHGVQDQDDVASDDLVTLAEVFRAAGYHTASFVSNFAAAPQFGTAQGFERVRFFDRKRDVTFPIDPKIGYVPVFFMDEELKQYLGAPGPEPHFTYIHTTDPHQPYRPPLEYLLWGQENRARYDGEVRYSDDFIGGWIETLRAKGQLENTIVVFTADHGEEFEEHDGKGHGHTVFEEIVRVPLVIAGPGVARATRDELVSLTDLPPTLLELCGIAIPDGFAPQGRSFATLLRAGAVAAPDSWQSAYHELIYPSKGIAFAYRDGRFKLVSIAEDSYGRRQQTRLYDLAADPREQRDLAASSPERVAQLREALKRDRTRQLQHATASLSKPLDAESEASLRALGYVQ